MQQRKQALTWPSSMDCADMFFGKHLLKHSQRREMAARHLSDPNGYVTQVNEALHVRPWPGKKGKTANRIQIRDESAYTRL
jgi:hypothetical protein